MTLNKYRPNTIRVMANALRAIEEDAQQSHKDEPHERVKVRGSTLAIVQQALNLMDDDDALLKDTGREGFG